MASVQIEVNEAACAVSIRCGRPHGASIGDYIRLDPPGTMVKVVGTPSEQEMLVRPVDWLERLWWWVSTRARRIARFVRSML